MVGKNGILLSSPFILSHHTKVYIFCKEEPTVITARVAFKPLIIYDAPDSRKGTKVASGPWQVHYPPLVIHFLPVLELCACIINNLILVVYLLGLIPSFCLV